MPNTTDVPDYYQMGPGTLKIPNSVFAANRAKICKRLTEKGIPRGAVLFFEGGKQEQQYDTDRDMEFQQESYFMYLFGVMEADFLGAIDVDTGKSILFMPRLPQSYAVWMGELKTPDYFLKRYGADHVFYKDEASEQLQKLRPSALYVLNGMNSDSGATFDTPNLEWMKDFKVNDSLLYNELAECRVRKSSEEMEIMRYVNRISCEAHKEVIKMMTPNRMEYEGEATFKHYAYMKGGMRFVGYTCICASGANNAVLHYGHAGEPNDKMVKDGDMLLFDMGAEYAGYTADITVSFPANGIFTEKQKFVYNTCLKANRAVLKAMKPGVKWPDMHRLAEKTIIEEFIKQGILANGTVEQMQDAHIGAIFMPHGLGHLIGLDVHDVGGYINAPPRIQEPGIKYLRTTRELEEGMVITVEPGVYFNDALIEEAYKNDEQMKYIVQSELEKYRGMGGVRIEDGVAVTANGSELLSKDVERSVEEIEAFMKDYRP